MASAKKILGVAIAIIIIVAVVASVAYFYILPAPTTPPTTPPPTTPPPSGPSSIKVACMTCLTGPFADVAVTIRDGYELAVRMWNERGGLRMPWGNVRIEYLVRDDETNVDVGTRRMMELILDHKILAAGGLVWAGMVPAIKMVYDYEVLYMSDAVAITALFNKDARKLPVSYSAQPAPWTLGYTAVKYCVENLGKTKFFFHGRSDTWGWDIYAGFKKAIEDYKAKGAVQVGYVEVPMGTPDFTPTILKAMETDAEVFVLVQFAGDCVNLLKQAYSLGLHKKMVIWVASLTNAVAVAVPPEALEGVYAAHFFYYDYRKVAPELYDKYSKDFIERYWNTYGQPPDSYATGAFIAFDILFQKVQEAGSLNWRDIVRTMIKNPKVITVKGPATIRVVTGETVYDEIAWFIVRGKGAAQRAHRWDLCEVVGYVRGPDVAMPPTYFGYPEKEEDALKMWGF